MPQLDLSTYPSQIFWLVVTFVVLYLLMAHVALPRIEGTVEGRRRKVEGDLDRAARMKTEAEAVIAAYDKALADARHQAQLTLKETAETLAAAATLRQREAAARIAAQAATAERRIAAARDAAMAELRGVAVDVAQAATARLIGRTVDPGRAAAAVDRVLGGPAGERAS